MKLERVRNLVTGGSGFLGSHLVDKLMEKGEKVISLDNFFTGNNLNNSKWLKNKNFEFKIILEKGEYKNPENLAELF